MGFARGHRARRAHRSLAGLGVEAGVADLDAMEHGSVSEREHRNRNGSVRRLCAGSEGRELMASVISVPPLLLDLDAIEQAARAATPGSWREGNAYASVVADACSCDCADHRYCLDEHSLRAYGGFLVGESMHCRDRDFLLAAQPQVVLALVA